jgi:hypothetical protein
MKVIAVHTIHGGKVVDGKNVELVAKPKAEFDTVDFGISDEEAQALIARGAIKRKMREITEADETRTRRSAGDANKA